MLKNKKKVVVTGGSGRFGFYLKKNTGNFKMYFPNKSELNIMNINSIIKYLKKIRPSSLIHLAGLSRPMNLHNKNISKSIDLNIVGTANIVKVCKKLKINCVKKRNIDAANKYLIDNINPDEIIVSGSLYLVGKIRKLYI